MATANTNERRKQVVVGELPNDFLRLTVPSTSNADRQVALDEQAARALQHELNSPSKQHPGSVIPGSRTVLGAPGFYGGFVPPNTRGRLSVTVLSRAFTTDERVAWAHISIPEAVFSNETVEDWYQLTGQQGEGKEGMIQMIFAFAPVDAPPIQYVPISQPPNLVLIPGQQPIVQPAVTYQQQQTGPLYTDEDVQEMCDMFPNVDKEVVTSVLDEKRGNKDAAVNALLSMTSD